MTANSCASQNKAERLVQSLVSGENTQGVDYYYEFNKLGKEAIPYLIEVIDAKKMGFVGFSDPTSSRIQTFHYNYLGIRAAYMIEYILSGAKEERLYNYCVVIRRSEYGQSMNALQNEDVQKIKEIYKNWWVKNQDKPLNLLIKNWHVNNRPLTNQAYQWV